jgi:hypothetical protein
MLKTVIALAGTLSLLSVAACGGAPDATAGDAENGAAEQDLTSGPSFTCTTRWSDNTFAEGFRLTIGTSTARIVDLATDNPKKPYTGKHDPSYRPTPGSQYAGRTRYSFAPRLADFPELNSLDLLVLPNMESGDVAYLRIQGPEGGATETYTCK